MAVPEGGGGRRFEGGWGRGAVEHDERVDPKIAFVFLIITVFSPSLSLYLYVYMYRRIQICMYV